MLNDPTLNRLERDLKSLYDRERALTDEIRQTQTDHQLELRRLEDTLTRELERIDRERKGLTNDIRFKETEISRHREQLLKEHSN